MLYLRKFPVRDCTVPLTEFVQHWYPHQLRHYAATIIEQKFGREAARTILGHTSAIMTDRYIAYDRPLAQRIAEEIG